MPRSTTSFFGEPDDFRATLQNEASLELFLTAHGEFRARLTQVLLDHLRLQAVEEHLPRVSFLAVPAGKVMVAFPVGDQPSLIWGGQRPRAGEFMTFGPGHRTHVRTLGPCRWGAIWLSAHTLTNHFHELTGRTLKIPPVAQLWRPRLTVGRRLLQLHGAAIHAAKSRPEIIVDKRAAHGMEQQLIEVLIECLSAGPLDEKSSARHRHQEILVRFEELLRTRQEQHLRAEQFGEALGVTDRLLRRCCAEGLGMSPTSYFRLRALHRVNHILRNQDPGSTSVSDVARCHGFLQLGRFAATYRSLFGELPSATLSRNLGRHAPISH
jgi:AraC-like DNA-binding protein